MRPKSALVFPAKVEALGGWRVERGGEGRSVWREEKKRKEGGGVGVVTRLSIPEACVRCLSSLPMT
ncbi:hypothetical protein BgiBS90_032248, partial [Biomphalaria glabrata]